MGDVESEERSESRAAAVFSLLLSKELIGSRKGQLLLAEVVSSFISFVCFCASTAAAFVTAPLLIFISTLLIILAHAVKYHQRFEGFHWPLMDFLRCITSSIIFFIISIMAVWKYPDGSSKAAGVFGFIATIVFALDFYFIFNELADFLKNPRELGVQNSNEESQNKADSDSD